MDIIFAGGKFRAKSKFAKIAKIYSTRKIGVIQYLYLLHLCTNNNTDVSLIVLMSPSVDDGCDVGLHSLHKNKNANTV